MTFTMYPNALKISIYGFAFLMLTACTKEEGCTDPQAMNFNPDAEQADNSCVYNQPAVVDLELPVLEFDVITELELEERLIVNIGVEDEAGGGYGIDLSLSSINNGKWFESTRGSNERFIPRLEWEILLPEVNLFDQLHDLVIKVTDVEGLETYYGREFTFKDTQAPDVTVDEFEVSVPAFGSGFIEFSASDLGAIGQVDVEWQIRPLGESSYSTKSTEEYDYRELGYNRDINLTSFESFEGIPGSFKVIITVTDLKGNQTIIEEEGVLI